MRTAPAHTAMLFGFLLACIAATEYWFTASAHFETQHDATTILVGVLHPVWSDGALFLTLLASTLLCVLTYALQKKHDRSGWVLTLIVSAGGHSYGYGYSAYLFALSALWAIYAVIPPRPTPAVNRSSEGQATLPITILSSTSTDDMNRVETMYRSGRIGLETYERLKKHIFDRKDHQTD